MLEVLHGFPELMKYVNSLYYCRYDQFFESLSKIYSTLIYAHFHLMMCFNSMGRGTV